MNPQPDRSRPQADAGVTLVEVVVAMLVFAVIASGIVAGMTTIARMTTDDRARVVAANLASEQTDLVRAIGDPFQIVGSTTTRSFPTADGGTRVYTIKRTTSWVSSAGADISCGSSTNLFFLRVHVLVSWTGELSTTSPVQSDTLVAPAGRITDPTSGTIAVSVVGRDGLPIAGIPVTIYPVSGGSALAVQPSPTNQDGCSYATKVAPGTYRVSLSRSGYLDVNQNPTPYSDQVVTVGTTQSVAFQYDRAGTFPVTYAAGYTPATPDLAPVLPIGLDTTFVNPTGGLYDTTSPSATVQLHPFSAGYVALAGALGTSAGTTTCAAVDPAAWPAATVAGTKLAAGQRPAPQFAAPGGTAQGALQVGMGVVLVKATAVGYLKAVQVGPGPGMAGEPQCTAKATYTFGPVLKNGTVAVALPYGTWTLFSGDSLAQLTPITGPSLSAPTNTIPDSSTITAAGVVTLDPRAAG
ncbi:MAG: prepilin-type N-terminal cleavage/methylation domain-containing protein [Amnibacterium sp.]